MANKAEEPRMRRIENHFDEESEVYDDVIEKIIPGYVEQNEVLLEALSLPSRPSRVADLGIGTGRLSGLVLERYPEATVVGYDISAGMIEECSDVLSEYSDRLELVRADLADIDLVGPFDAIISGLAVHHLEDPAKRDLFGRILDALAPGGHFVMREIVLGETEEETETLHLEWRAFITDNGLDADEVLAAHDAEDKPAPLADQLTWLRGAGFAEVRPLWQRVNFAVLEGRRAGG